MKWYLALSIGGVFLLFSEDALAWGPATHFHYGMLILDQLKNLAEPVRALLSSQPISFLYGSLSADIVLAKKLGRAMTHCHRWDMGAKLIQEAPTPRIQAFAYGYVAHLAADTISHNCYVPSKTIESYDSGVLKHMYWELLFDRKVTTHTTLRRFEEIAKGDFQDCDEHMERLIPTRIFDFSFNKKIFNQILLLQRLRYWQKLWTNFSDKSPWPLQDREVVHFTQRSVNVIVSYFNEGEASVYCSLDPNGQVRLRSAHELRRIFKKELRSSHPPSARRIRQAAERFAREPFRVIPVDDLKAA